MGSSKEQYTQCFNWGSCPLYDVTGRRGDRTDWKKMINEIDKQIQHPRDGTVDAVIISVLQQQVLESQVQVGDLSLDHGTLNVLFINPRTSEPVKALTITSIGEGHNMQYRIAGGRLEGWGKTSEREVYDISWTSGPNRTYRVEQVDGSYMSKNYFGENQLLKSTELHSVIKCALRQAIK